MRRIKNILAFALMLSAAGIAVLAKPTKQIIAPDQRVDYEKVIPTHFGSWKIIPIGSNTIVNPQAEEKLSALYAQTVTRSYIDTKTGKIIMLSAAYGEEQNKQSQVHLPEVCYPAQGFEIIKSRKDEISTRFGKLPVKRVLAKSGNRIEPITYWIRIGDTVARGNFEQKILIIKKGLSGKIEDGLLLRVSSISNNIEEAHELQDRFLQEMIQASQEDYIPLLVGKSAPH